MWRREISPRLSEVPVVGGLIEKVWPTPIRVPYTSSQGPESPIERLARSLSAGLLLPFAAYATGKSLFRCVRSTPKQVVLVSVPLYMSVVRLLPPSASPPYTGWCGLLCFKDTIEDVPSPAGVSATRFQKSIGLYSK